MTDSNYDVIIIGSGMGGLFCGTLLAKCGLKILILEKQVIPGGYLTTFTRKGYHFDASLHMINGCNEGKSTYEMLIEAGVKVSFYKPSDKIPEIALNEVRLIPVKETCRLINEDEGLDFIIPTDWEEYKSKLIKVFPHEKKNLEGFFKDIEEVQDLFINFSRSGKLGREEEISERPELSERFLKGINATAQDFIDDHGITDTKLLKILSVLCGFLGVMPDRLSQLMYIAGVYSYNFGGAHQVIGGSGALVSALAECYKNYGGEIKYKSLVDEILIDEESKTATGIKLLDGTEYTSKYVISNADATHTFNDLIKVSEEFKKSNRKFRKMVERLNSRVTSPSAVICYFGLNRDLREAGITDYEIFHTKGFPTEDELKIYMKNLDFDKFPGFAMTFYSNVDPTCCPSGKSILACIYYSDIEPFRKVLDVDGKRGKKYKELKEKIALGAIRRASKFLHIPDLEEGIEVMEVATPITLERYTNNKDGAFIGWSSTPEQTTLHQIPQRMPIKNLFLASAWAMPGGGVSAVMMGGEEAARRILKIEEIDFKLEK